MRQPGRRVWLPRPAVGQAPDRSPIAAQENWKVSRWPEWLIAQEDKRPIIGQGRDLARPYGRAAGRARITTGIEPQRCQSIFTSSDSLEISIPVLSTLGRWEYDFRVSDCSAPDTLPALRRPSTARPVPLRVRDLGANPLLEFTQHGCQLPARSAPPWLFSDRLSAHHLPRRHGRLLRFGGRTV